jgi:sugar transferase EpsL
MSGVDDRFEAEGVNMRQPEGGPAPSFTPLPGPGAGDGPAPDRGQVPRHRRRPQRLKRAVDVVGALVGLIVALPILVVVAAAVAVSLGRPVLFRQQRAGRLGKPFTIVKFRTMRDPRPGEEGPAYDHLRLNRLGRILRSTSLDELPELWNVLRGDMSLVGPRPLPITYVDRYDLDQARRLNARPGLTGWAQVNGRNAVGWMEKLAYDQWYVRHQSFRLDVKIILMTIMQVVRREGVDHAEGVTMHEFRGTTRPTSAAPAQVVDLRGRPTAASPVRVIDLRESASDGGHRLPPPKPEERQSA